MPISDETLQALIRDYQGFELTDEELALVRPEVESYLSELALWDDLDLSAAMSSRLIRVPYEAESGKQDPGNQNEEGA
jgi:hypothetical protein